MPMGLRNQVVVVPFITACLRSSPLCGWIPALFSEPIVPIKLQQHPKYNLNIVENWLDIKLQHRKKITIITPSLLWLFLWGRGNMLTHNLRVTGIHPIVSWKSKKRIIVSWKVFRIYCVIERPSMTKKNDTKSSFLHFITFFSWVGSAPVPNLIWINEPKATYPR